MGTKVDCKSYLPLFYSMRDLNEDSSSGSWPLLYRDNNAIQNGLFHPGHNKDTLKQKMLEHEAVFKNQVNELHRLYRIQRDMMQEFKRKETHKHRASMEASSSTSQQDSRKWHMAGFPLSSPNKNRTFSGVEIFNNNDNNNNSTTKESELFDPRPLKMRKKSFDLQLPADQYIDTEETETKSYLRGSIGFADLNEPVRIEEGISPPCVDFLSSNTGRLSNSKTGYFGVLTVNARDGFLTNSSAESKVCERGQMSYIHQGGSTSGNFSSVPQIRPPVIYPNGYNYREDMWRERLRNGPEASNSSHSGHIETSGSYPFFNNYSWAKPSNNFGQKVTTLETLSTNRNHHHQLNGFCHASASGSKELLQKEDTTFRNGSILENSKPKIDINLNEEVFPQIPSNEIEILQDLNTTDGKSNPVDHLSALPWLRPRKSKPSGWLSSLCASSKNETSDCEIAETQQTVKKILGFPVFGRDNNIRAHELAPIASTSAKSERKNGMIDINVACEPDDELIIVEKEKPKNGSSIRNQIDLNSCLSDCEEEEEESPNYENRKSAKVKITLEIDLEVPFLIESEDEDHSALSKENIPNKESLKPPVVEHKIEQTQDEVLTTAAETMIAISSYCPQIHTTSEDSLAEALLWLADSLSSSQIDEFEAMVLQIAETREEDYLPKPFVLETGPVDALPTKPRRGSGRRGRQKRDFQRDILPGLVSLSRHEVTEDLQIFGGLMKAMGHSWTRRNGAAARGRKRAAVETAPQPAPVVIAPLVNCVEDGLVDRSLTGWGKITRRPRRQRCPTGNSNNTPSVALA